MSDIDISTVELIRWFEDDGTPAWKTEDGYRVEKVLGALPWMIFSPPGSRNWRTYLASNLDGARRIIARLRAEEAKA